MRLVAIILLTTFTLCTHLFAQWEQCSIPKNSAVSCFAASGSTIFAGTAAGLLLSTDSGASWNIVDIGTLNKTPSAINIDDTRIVVAARGILESAVITSTDKGKSWTEINTGLTNREVNSFARIGTNLFAGTSSGVFLTTNNGAEWVKVSSGLTDTAVATVVAVGTHLVAGTSSGKVFLSTNNGATWSQTATSPPTTSLNCMAASGVNLYVGTHGDGAFLSTNSGASWSPISTGLGDKKVLTLYANAPNLFAGTYGTGVLRSTNNGVNWEEINTGLLALRVRAVFVHSSYLFAGTTFGLYRRPLSEVLTSVEATSTETLNTWCYPNPASDVFTVSIPSAMANNTGAMRYSILNLRGEEVMHIDSESESIRIPTNALSSGTYTIVATRGTQRLATMVSVLR